MAKVLLTDYTAVKDAANTLYEAIHKTSYTWVNNPSVGTKATAAQINELYTVIESEKAAAEAGATACKADLAGHYTGYKNAEKGSHNSGYDSKTNSHNSGHHGGWMGGRRTHNTPQY